MATYDLVDAPLIEMPRGTDAAREAMGFARFTDEGPLQPVDGGFVTRTRMGKFAFVSPTGDVRELAIGGESMAGYPSRWAPLPAHVSKDGKKLVVVDDGKLAIFSIADGAKKSLDHAALVGAWMGDDRAVVADGATLDVVSTSDSKVLASTKLAAKPYQIQLAALESGLVVAALGEPPLNKRDGTPMKQRAFEVYLFEGGTLARVGKRAKATFSIVVPRDGEMYFVEATFNGPWLSNKRGVLAA